MAQFDTFRFDEQLFDDPGESPSGYLTVITEQFVYTATLNIGGAPTESRPPVAAM